MEEIEEEYDRDDLINDTVAFVWDETKLKLVLKEFRYDFLLEYEKQIERFRYEDLPGKKGSYLQ